MRKFYFHFIFILLLFFFDWFNLGDEYAYAVMLSPNELELPEIIKEKWSPQNKNPPPKNLKTLRYLACEKTTGGLKCEEKILKKNPSQPKKK